MGEELHQRRVEILRYLARRARGGGPPPSVREIGAAVGLRSSQTVHHHLGWLEEEGYVARVGRGARMLGLTGKGWEAAGQIALLGRIAAGRGLEAVAFGDDAYSLAAELLSARSGRQRYLLRVVGQSMVGARIEDGDLLVVEEDEAPPDGAVVVALLGGGDEVTVKRLYREGEKVRLRPENGGHQEILVPADEIRVQGRVVYVVHPPRRGPSGDGS
ncbi:MAG TPA: transcriptional repressor LexA [Rubrobacter sp.]